MIFRFIRMLVVQSTLVAILSYSMPLFAEDALTFERDIRPIFRAHCFDCHGAQKEHEGNLDLRLRRFAVQGGESGGAIIPGDPDQSLLLERIEQGDMPPGDAKVSAAEIALIRKWIAGGAITARDEPEQIEDGLGITFEERSFWAFQPVVRPAIPIVEAVDRVRTPIDAFLLAKLQQQGLTYSPETDRSTLLMRACFALTGLPPTDEQLAQFENDSATDAYEKLIDRLLDSPHYGERWARHWLDIAGYADSEGYSNQDTDRPYAYKYRDYVINAFNADKPLDQFIIEQLAGDELAESPLDNTSPRTIELLTATGFLRMAADGTGDGSVDQELARNQVMTDTIKIVSTSLLGLSVGCAQCHDHRYDPISQRDYYRMRAIFEPALDWKSWKNPNQRRFSMYTTADQAKRTEIEAEVAVIVKDKNEKQTLYIQEALTKELEKYEEPLRNQLREAYETTADKRSAEQQKLLAENPSVNISPGVLYQYNQAHADDLKTYDKRIEEVRKQIPVEEFLRALIEADNHSPDTFLFHRGDHRQPTDKIPPGRITVCLSPEESVALPEQPESTPTTKRRLAYARWLTSGQHPLVARVIVNRIWLQHFGRGLVDTPADFGKLGMSPSHPELLDWLADEFVQSGWSLKALHKLLMTSSVYRQISQRSAANDQVDRTNQYLWFFPVRRLEAEIIRDRILWTSGVLSDQMYGPPVNVQVDEAGQVSVPVDSPRRSLYIQVKRTQPDAFLTTFDLPVMESNCDRRSVSTSSMQSLAMMNGSFILAQAALMAERVRQDATRMEPSAMVDAINLKTERPAENWQYGWGSLTEDRQQITRFTPLPHWTGSTWQGGASLPDENLGWVLLHAAGGHPGNNDHAAIRRWISPVDAEISIKGSLNHPNENGDGVTALAISSLHGQLGNWTAFHNTAETLLEKIRVVKGETLDFVVHCNASENSDSFSWNLEISAAAAEGTPAQSWNSQNQFRGPATAPVLYQIACAWHRAYRRSATEAELQLAADFVSQQVVELTKTMDYDAAERQAITNLCQALIVSNEFIYVD
jgi:hypothetical protein